MFHIPIFCRYLSKENFSVFATQFAVYYTSKIGTSKFVLILMLTGYGSYELMRFLSKTKHLEVKKCFLMNVFRDSFQVNAVTIELPRSPEL